jgi:hypothetical protein
VKTGDHIFGGATSMTTRYFLFFLFMIGSLLPLLHDRIAA